MKRVALAAAAALVVLLGVGIGAHGAQNTLVVTAPAYVNLNTPFSVTVTVTDGTNPIPTNTDRVYVTVNRTQSNLSGLTTNGVVTINGLRATTSPVVLVVTDPARSLTKTLSIGGGTGAPPSITSTNAVSFTLNQAGSHTVTTTGSPTAQLTCTGLPGVGFPAGVTFTNLGNGTGTLAGTPAVSGTFTFVVIATNGVAPNAQQTLTLTIPAAPPPPVVRQFRSTINPIGTARHEHSSTLLLNGKVLIAGGSNAAGVVHNTALLFDPSNETFTPTATLMVQGRYSHTATRLLDGRVLLTGGYTQTYPMGGYPLGFRLVRNVP